MSRGPARTAEAGRSLLRELARRQRDHERAPDLGRCRGGLGRGQWQRRDLRARQGANQRRTHRGSRASRRLDPVAGCRRGPVPCRTEAEAGRWTWSPWRGDAAAMQRERDVRNRGKHGEEGRDRGGEERDEAGPRRDHRRAGEKLRRGGRNRAPPDLARCGCCGAKGRGRLGWLVAI